MVECVMWKEGMGAAKVRPTWKVETFGKSCDGLSIYPTAAAAITHAGHMHYISALLCKLQTRNCILQTANCTATAPCCGHISTYSTH